MVSVGDVLVKSGRELLVMNFFYAYIFCFIQSFALRAAQNIPYMDSIGDVLVFALRAAQNIPYMDSIGDVLVFALPA